MFYPLAEKMLLKISESYSFQGDGNFFLKINWFLLFKKKNF